MQTDIASTLIRLYEEIGLRALEKLNGWFCGLLVDLRHRQAVLFNDRYGLNRIYVHEDNGRLCFSSEAKSLLAVVPSIARIGSARPGGMVQLRLCFGKPDFVSRYLLLPPGSAWIFSADGR